VDAETGQPLDSNTPGHPVTHGVPCTAYIGPNGAGHYVKMIHNGIEYIIMQLISEAYELLRTLLPAQPDEVGRIFATWNAGDLASYLIEITGDILQQRDPAQPEGFLVDDILDTASQKGTGKWTSINALDLGIPANTIGAAVFARFLSALKDERVTASQHLHGPAPSSQGDRDDLIIAVHDALYCATICAYAQGFQLMR
jgi:6-phosphogluconate dehydrogenase